ncbi:MAG: hypothetical protein WCK54_12955 [Desulfuromonadales bacterium]
MAQLNTTEELDFLIHEAGNDSSKLLAWLAVEKDIAWGLGNA